MALTREVRVKPTFGHLYPDVRPGGWESAAAVAGRVAERTLTRRGYAALLGQRVLPDAHFEFRGGPPEELAAGGHVSRLVDRKR